MNINDIRQLCASNSIQWTDHIVKRLVQRGITRQEVKSVLSNGEIIEEYLDDCPYPSCLVSGTTDEYRHLHVVCGIGGGKLWIISAYYPNLVKWEEGFKKRKKEV
ncbi:MAG: DUF4258 domain-containing protein [Oscillospiraceae bacterium]|jgi:hypothetical protein|nr:DUF4258 domain-containing protein [Oscillospiraceae bacterium]